MDEHEADDEITISCLTMNSKKKAMDLYKTTIAPAIRKDFTSDITPRTRIVAAEFVWDRKSLPEGVSVNHYIAVLLDSYLILN